MSQIVHPFDAQFRSVRIAGVGTCLPDRVVTSRELEHVIRARSSRARLPGGFIERVSGVRSRRFRAPGQESSDLAAAASRDALDQSNLTPADVDAVIFAAASQDLTEPATAALVQAKVGCHGAFVLDVKNACSSFINGLDVAHVLVQTRRADVVLVASGEVNSVAVDLDIDTVSEAAQKFAALTLGDGGAAAVVTAADGDTTSRLYPSTLLSDGRYWRTSVVPGGGSRDGGTGGRRGFECDPGKLAEVAAEVLPGLIEATLERMGWPATSVAAIVPHQVATHHLGFFTQGLGFAEQTIKFTVADIGNVAAASIPITLTSAVRAGEIVRGDRVLLVSGAGGFSAGVTPIVW